MRKQLPSHNRAALAGESIRRARDNHDLIAARGQFQRSMVARDDHGLHHDVVIVGAAERDTVAVQEVGDRLAASHRDQQLGWG